MATPHQQTKQKDYGVARALLLGLIYPSVLGTFLMKIIDRITTIIRSGENEHLDISSLGKALLVLGILLFFCCDYVWGSITKTYTKFSVALDGIAITCLLVSFNAINMEGVGHYTNTMHIITIAMLIFFGTFLVWDLYVVKSNKVILISTEKNFYESLLLWELVFGILLSGLLVLDTFWKLPETAVSFYLAAVIFFAAAYYLYKLPQKHRFEMLKEQDWKPPGYAGGEPPVDPAGKELKPGAQGDTNNTSAGKAVPASDPEPKQSPAAPAAATASTAPTESDKKQ